MSCNTWTGAPAGTVVHTVGTTVTIYQPALDPTRPEGSWTT